MKKLFNNGITSLVFDIMRLESKAFVPIGLMLNEMGIYFDTNETFPLKDMTFGFYNPVDNSIHINIEDKFFSNTINHSDKLGNLFFILFHEVMHKMLCHSERCGNRDKMLWNIAADYEIHNMLYIYSNEIKFGQLDASIINTYLKRCNILLDSPKSEFLFDKKYLDNIAEEIYEELKDTKQIAEESFSISLDQMMDNPDNPTSGNNSGVTVKVKKITYKLPNGQEISNIDIEWPKNYELPAEYQTDENEKDQQHKNTIRNRSLMENSFIEMSKQKGDISAACSKFLKKIFHVKIDWTKILRNSLQTVLEKTDYFAWNNVRTSTFLMHNMPYLPAIVEDEEKYGTLIISRDESGSMTNDDIAKAAHIIMEAKAHYKKIVLIKHDTVISNISEFDELTPDILTALTTRESFGGTSHKAVFEYIRSYKFNNPDENISCYIGITDLESDIESTQKLIPNNVPIIYLTPYKIDNHLCNIKGQIIPIE